MASGSGPPSFTPPWPFLVLCSWPIASILVVNSPKKLRLARHSLALSESVKFYRVRPRLESSLRWIGEKDGITRLSAANRANCWSNVFKRSGDTRHAWPHTFGSQICLFGNLGWNIKDFFHSKTIYLHGYLDSDKQMGSEHFIHTSFALDNKKWWMFALLAFVV